MELRPAGATAMEKSTAMPGMHGQFEFGSVKPGHYILPVNKQRGSSNTSKARSKDNPACLRRFPHSF